MEEEMRKYVEERFDRLDERSVVREGVFVRLESIENRIEGIIRREEDLELRINNRASEFVTWRTFFWIIGFLVSLQMALFGVIYTRIEKVADVTQKTQADVSFLNGKLQDAIIQR